MNRLSRLFRGGIFLGFFWTEARMCMEQVSIFGQVVVELVKCWALKSWMMLNKCVAQSSIASLKCCTRLKYMLLLVLSRIFRGNPRSAFFFCVLPSTEKENTKICQTVKNVWTIYQFIWNLEHALRHEPVHNNLIPHPPHPQVQYRFIYQLMCVHEHAQIALAQRCRHE